MGGLGDIDGVCLGREKPVFEKSGLGVRVTMGGSVSVFQWW